MSDRDERLEELRLEGGALRDALGAMAVEWGRRSALTASQAAVLESVAMLGAWSMRGLDDPRFFDEMTEARAALERSRVALPPGSAAEDGPMVAEALERLDALREAAVEELVVRKSTPLRAIDGAVAAAAPVVFVASGGVPSVHDIPIPPPELLATEEELEEAEDEDDDHDDDEDEWDDD
jgi:hypothetical protein